MFSRRSSRRLNRGRRAAGVPFTPAALANLQLWTRSDDTPGTSYETSTSPDIRRIDSLTNRGALGGTMAQSTSANKPVNASFPEGRAAFFDGSNDDLQYSGAASDLNCIHDGTGATVFVAMRPIDATAAVHVVFATNDGGGNQEGVLFRTIGSGAGRITISDGTATDSYDSGAGVFADDTTSVLCMRHGSGETNKIDLRVDGSQITSGAYPVTAYSTITPSASDAEYPLTIGSRVVAQFFQGYIPEVIVYNRYLTDAECAQVEAYLQRWTMAITYAELQTASVAGLYQLVAFLHSTGSAWEDALGNYTVTEVDSPSHGTSASFNGKNVMTLNGSTQYAHFDALASQFDGNDTPITILSVHEADDVLGNYRVLGINGGSDNRNTFGPTTGPAHNYRRDDGTTSASASQGTASTNAEVAAVAFRQTSGTGVATWYVNAALVSSEVASETGALTLDTATTGADRINGGDFSHFPGDIAAQLISGRYLNYGDYLAIHYALATEFGL